MDSKNVAKTLFSGIVRDDIVYFMLSNYSKINNLDFRFDLGNGAVASDVSDLNWNSLRRYAKDRNLGEVVESRNKRRWAVNNLNITINKVDNNLKPSNPYVDDSNQIPIPFESLPIDITFDHPLVIGYVPDITRSFIKEIHVIKYKADGTVDWNLPIYRHNEVQKVENEQERKNIKSIIKVKTPESNVVGLFDKNGKKD